MENLRTHGLKSQGNKNCNEKKKSADMNKLGTW